MIYNYFIQTIVKCFVYFPLLKNILLFFFIESLIFIFSHFFCFKKSWEKIDNVSQNLFLRNPTINFYIT